MARPRGDLDPRGQAAQVLQRLKREPAGWRRERLLAAKLGLEGQLTFEEIAAQLGRARSCVQRWLREKGGLQVKLGTVYKYLKKAGARAAEGPAPVPPKKGPRGGRGLPGGAGRTPRRA